MGLSVMRTMCDLRHLYHDARYVRIVGVLYA